VDTNKYGVGFKITIYKLNLSEGLRYRKGKNDESKKRFTLE
jgi:hypothetical protein